MFSNKKKLYKIVIKEKLCISFREFIRKKGLERKWGIIKRLF